MSPHVPVIRIEEAGLGLDAQVRLVLSGLPDIDRLHRPWASSGATIERRGERMHATTTVEALTRAVGRALGKEVAAQVDDILRRAVAAWQGEPVPAVSLPGGGSLATGARPLVMGVVNVTPDSFSDGGAIYHDGHPEAAIALAKELVAQGADLLDVGGESSRPGAERVAVDEELRRVLPVIEGLAGLHVPISIDTVKAEVAAAALDAGATIVNDVGGGTEELLELVADRGAAYVLMHTRGTPADMQSLATYTDVVGEVYEHLADGLQRCESAGIERDRVVVDPGIGFAKRPAHNLELLHGLRQLRGLGRPLLVGASRKSFIGAVLDDAPAEDRLEGSLACAVAAVSSGAAIVRAHDVAETVRAVRMAHAIARGALPA